MFKTIETRILGGLPIEVEFEVIPASPSVGIYYTHVGVWNIIKIGKRYVKDQSHAFWLYNRIAKDKYCKGKLINAMNDAIYHYVDAI